MGEIGRGDKVFAGRRPWIVRLVRAVGQPITECDILGPDAVLPGLIPNVLHPCLHAGILRFENARVAIDQVHGPGNDHTCIGPG